MKNLIRNLIVASVFVLCPLAAVSCNPALAADMQLKAPPRFAPVDPCTQQSCSGWYVGGDLMGIVSSIDVIGQGINNSILAGGGIIGGHVGYQFWNGKWFLAFEGGVAYQASNNGAVAPALGTDRIVGTELVKIGYGLAGIFGQAAVAPATPTQSPVGITVPASLTEALITPYIITGAMQRGRSTQAVSGVGSEFLLAQQWNLSLDYLYGAPMDNKPALNLVRLGLNYKFR